MSGLQTQPLAAPVPLNSGSEYLFELFEGTTVPLASNTATGSIPCRGMGTLSCYVPPEAQLHPVGSAAVTSPWGHPR